MDLIWEGIISVGEIQEKTFRLYTETMKGRSSAKDVVLVCISNTIPSFCFFFGNAVPLRLFSVLRVQKCRDC